ncbi:hypothetical protein COEREDRAFT_15340 [Coemansia reversa NRRL 1564]|uniref:Uncharacterized protein n=1 Tax=Coemansia reversa (strain ATCC 12441 / NRRL 1564) TaxID=763665 RepID=A0A2G5BC09_COERN|nr:hypothetical protein COEREDRAFT_15340 [Coemansia reversa NRRL 1564]|eukprot:PIA16540.1 hypothetical protein COEREDRAFT_15340 [Coemansia reversa NRRL 1564]
MGRSLRANRRRPFTLRGSSTLTMSYCTHHPYEHSQDSLLNTNATIASRCPPNVISGSVLSTSLTPVLTSTPAQEILASVSTTLPNAPSVVKVDNNNVRESNVILDNSWSPFDTPAVRECLASSSITLPSLLERVEQSPLYCPSQNSSTFEASSIVRDPNQFATTYSGHLYPSEQITVQIVDLESGEYLRRFPL